MNKEKRIIHDWVMPGNKPASANAKSDMQEFHGHPDYLVLTQDELELHSAKNRDYARFGNPLGNFYRVSDALKAQGLSLSPTQVALVFAQKQQDAAMQMINNGYEGEVEGVDERLRDVHVYYKIARILYREERDAKTKLE